MTEVVTIGDATLYCGDCLEILPTLAKVDAVVTDPPYGINYVKGAGGHGKHSRRNCVPIHGDQHPFDPSPLLVFHNVLMFGGDHFAYQLPRGRWLLWDKQDGMKLEDSFSDLDVAWHSKPGAARIFRYRWKGIAGVKHGENGGRRDHPTQKPLGLMRWCIEQVSPASLILDPFMGSGSTGVAAMQLGRRFIGIEIDRGYFDIACERIDAAQRQGRLFDSLPVHHHQEALTL